MGNTNYDVPTKEYVDDLVSSGTINISNAVNYNDTPIGTIISYMGTTAPRDYLICNGTIYNIIDYKELADFINVQFGSYNKFGGNGTTTFAVPDLRGEFLRGSGINSHTNQGSGAEVGIHQDGTVIPNILGEAGVQMRINTTGTKANSYILNADKSAYLENGQYYYIANVSVLNDSAHVAYSHTIRSTNTSVLYCIKYTTSVLSTPENNFSTTEQKIGTWINGKPLYQKTIVATAPDEENVLTELCLLPENVNTTNVFDMKVTAHNPNSYACFTNYYYSTAEAITFWIRPNRKITCVIRSTSWLNSTLYITLQYTKTTD